MRLKWLERSENEQWKHSDDCRELNAADTDATQRMNIIKSQTQSDKLCSSIGLKVSWDRLALICIGQMPRYIAASCTNSACVILVVFMADCHYRATPVSHSRLAGRLDCSVKVSVVLCAGKSMVNLKISDCRFDWFVGLPTLHNWHC